jgi:hypothetical protein
MSKEFIPKKGDIVVEITLSKKYREKEGTNDSFELEIVRHRLEHINDCSPNVKLMGLDKRCWETTEDKRDFGKPVRIMDGWVLRDYEKRIDKRAIQCFIKEANSAFQAEKKKASAHVTYVNDMLKSINEHKKALMGELKTVGKLNVRKQS